MTATAATLIRRGVRLPGPGNWMLIASVTTLLVFIAMAVFAPLIAPHNPDAVNLADTLAGPSPAHWLGTDGDGRDVLSRIIFGARTSLIGPLFVVAGAAVLGVGIGLLCAWRGGWVDSVLSRVIELVFAFPGILLAILVVAVFGAGLMSVVLALVVAYTPYLARLARSVAMAERSRPYVQALELHGFGALRIMARHVLVNIAPFLLAQCALCFGYALIDLAGLSYLGFGVQPPGSDWGEMISEAQSAIIQGRPLSALAPGVCIVLAVIAFNLLGEAISDRIRGEAP
jgi:peptide/nickel transport system permease protein